VRGFRYYVCVLDDSNASAGRRWRSGSGGLRGLSSRLPYLVEQFIAGRELTVGVIDQGDGPSALPPLEIEVDPGHAFDYAGKYLDPGTREICPAHISSVMRETAEDVALAAHTTLGCEGYSRTDMIAAADDHIYFLELNTLPGLTSSSLVPKELAAARIDFRDFLEKQIELARVRPDRLKPVPHISESS
jgi:D-alanine-D-alanine ligase